jgi:flagellar biosynthesis/type III secretory pathway ATPase
MENQHVANAKKVLRLLALYAEIEDLVNIRAYVEGNIEFDTAIKSREKILQFLQQDSAVSSPLEMTKKHLADLAQWIDQTEKALRAAQTQQQQRKAPTR